MAKRCQKGKSCGASCVAASKACEVEFPSAVNRAIGQASAAINGRMLWEAVGALDKKNNAKFGAIRKAYQAELQGQGIAQIRKPEHVGELRRRAQAAGLLPKKQEGSNTGELEGERSRLLSEGIKAMKAGDEAKYAKLQEDFIRVQKQLNEKKGVEVPEPRQLERSPGARTLTPEASLRKSSQVDSAILDDISRLLRGESARVLSLYEDEGKEGVGVARKDKTQIGMLQSALGLGKLTRQDVGRDRSGLIAEAEAVKSQLGKDYASLMKKQQELVAKNKIQEALKYDAELRDLAKRVNDLDLAIAGPPILTGASRRTRVKREDSKDIDAKLANEPLDRVGDKKYDGWADSYASGSKVLGAGSFGTAIRHSDKKTVVKRGDVSSTEPELIKRVGDADLGPKLIAADLDGPGREPTSGVDVRRGRLAMGFVPGTPIGKKKPERLVGGVKVADAYWKARADLHRLGIAHNDMHIENVLIDKTGKGRFVDMGLAQGSPKAALAEAMGAFEPIRGTVKKSRQGRTPGDWQVKRWEGTGGGLLGNSTTSGLRELQKKAPLLARVRENKNAVQFALKKRGFTDQEISDIINHGIRSPMSSYNKGVWSKLTDQDALDLINMLYEGV
jgi:hypothetical protein